MPKPALAFIGTGKVGFALASGLYQRGYPVAALCSRTPEKARQLAGEVKAVVADSPAEAARLADVVFITTPDRVIKEIDEIIARDEGYRAGQIVMHASGSLPAGILEGARTAGAGVLSFHPLQSFTGTMTAHQNLPGSYFALEGDVEALFLGRQMVSDLEGKSFVVPTQAKPLYHAAACVASNYLVSLLHLGTVFFKQFGLTEEDACQALLPLVRGTLKNIERLGTVRALTGPVERGDIPTIEEHLEALKFFGERERDLYCRLGGYTVGVALSKGSIDSARARILLDLFRPGQS